MPLEQTTDRRATRRERRGGSGASSRGGPDTLPVDLNLRPRGIPAFPSSPFLDCPAHVGDLYFRTRTGDVPRQLSPSSMPRRAFARSSVVKLGPLLSKHLGLTCTPCHVTSDRLPAYVSTARPRFDRPPASRPRACVSTDRPSACVDAWAGTDPNFVQKLKLVQQNPQLAQSLFSTDPRLIDVIGALMGLDVQGFGRPEGSDDLPPGVSPTFAIPPTSPPPSPAKPTSPPKATRGNQLFKEGDFAGAVKGYMESIKHDPSDARGYNNHALAYTKLVALPEALKDVEEVIRVDPNFGKPNDGPTPVHVHTQRMHTCPTTFRGPVR
ncbi:hypothetical protein BC827DRAFT_138537 [Russula dissimulans]|nr:hypothetical protein BC827DRAFT_138537 [Russula dissimulans]